MSYQSAPLEHVRRIGDSTFRTPTPPRIIVPPPSLNSNAIPEITLKALGWDNRNFVHSNALLEWNYERRREAQMILPYLYLGPMSAAKDGTFLTSNGITMVLGIRQKHGLGAKLMQNAMLKAQELGIHWAVVDVGSDQELAAVFPLSTRTISDHLIKTMDGNGKVQGKVLVFCESGNERSAAVAAAYLMEAHEDVDFIKAIQLCQAQRFCTNFDDKLKGLLQARWGVVVAERQTNGIKLAKGKDFTNEVGMADVEGHVTAGANTPTGQYDNAMDDGMMTNGYRDMGATGNGNSGGAKQKRGLELDEDDERMDDEARFGGRQFAPFEDVSSPDSSTCAAAYTIDADTPKTDGLSADIDME